MKFMGSKVAVGIVSSFAFVLILSAQVAHAGLDKCTLQVVFDGAVQVQENLAKYDGAKNSSNQKSCGKTHCDPRMAKIKKMIKNGQFVCKLGSQTVPKYPINYGQINSNGMISSMKKEQQCLFKAVQAAYKVNSSSTTKAWKDAFRKNSSSCSSGKACVYGYALFENKYLLPGDYIWSELDKIPKSIHSKKPKFIKCA